MKIHEIALSTFLLLAGTDFDTGALAFVPRNSISNSHFASPSELFSTHDTTTTEGLSSAQKVGVDLRLLYTPIAPFGKGAPNALDYDESLAKKVLGGKGANLSEMSKLGLSVPPGFTITTECCDRYCNDASWNSGLPQPLWEEIVRSIDYIQNEMQSEFGSPKNPLLLSVRSGAAISMPGMMDTVLNLGMNDDVVVGLAEKTENPRFAWDSYRRFLEMFGNVVLEIPRSLFEDELDDLKYERGVDEDSDLSEDDLKELVTRFKAVYETKNLSFPQDVYEQLKLSICAVFNGWMGPRAIKYRAVENIRDLLGTAVNVQAMVFGNMGETSGTGVCFSRDPNIGTPELFGEFLINAQGEDVVAGVRTPKPIAEMEKILPEVYKEFLENTKILEETFGDMQDIEFTIQEGKLFMLQTRNGKRGGEAAVKIAVDLVSEGLIDPLTAINKVLPEHLDQLLHPRFPDVELQDYKDAVLSTGLPASPGAAVGQIALSNEMVVSNQEKGIRSILVRDETSPDDVEGMFAAEGILTARGGMTSHAAVVARGWGKPCICGCTSLSVDEANKSIIITLEDGSEKTFQEGDFLSLNGQTGEVLEGSQTVAPPAITGNLKTFMDWVDETREIDVLTNADTPQDAKEARKNGANGIGLCRSEHMFFKPERISKVRQLILGDEAQEKEALEELLKFQREDYEGIFREMDGLPVTVRLLDPPLHEFLPSLKEESVLAECSKQLGITVDALKEKVEAMGEVNPMLGLRGCRLGITRPSIVKMQTRAILEAALNAIEEGIDARPDIMVPLVGRVEEFLNQKALIQSVASQVFEERGTSCEYKIGTMIEIPRAALMAHQIAEEAEFFSFGSNDLTQMTFGYSRDDVGSFVPDYLGQGILKDDPFVTLDTEGVGQLIQMTVDKGRQVRPGLKIGVCGEHGGDPRSIRFFSNEAGLSYVSCSPFRVPIARLAAAQATVENNKTKKA